MKYFVTRWHLWPTKTEWKLCLQLKMPNTSNFSPNQKRRRHFFFFFFFFFLFGLLASFRWPWTEFVVFVFLYWFLLAGSLWQMFDGLFVCIFTLSCLPVKFGGSLKQKQNPDSKMAEVLKLRTSLGAKSVGRRGLSSSLCARKGRRTDESQIASYFGWWRQKQKVCALLDLLPFHLLWNEHGNSRTHPRRTCFSLAHT